MLDRLEPILKVLCAALVALLLFQVVRLAARSNPLAHLNIPALPSLPSDTNAPAGGAASNHVAAAGSTNAATNAALTSVTAAPGATNNQIAAGAGGTTNALTNFAQTNVTIAPGATNSLVAHIGGTTTNPVSSTPANAATNLPILLAADASATNRPAGLPASKMQTNAVSGTNSAATNVATLPPGSARLRPGSSPHMPPGMPGVAFGPSGRPGMSPLPELPLPIRARVYQVVDSEVLGPVMHPMPMALLGIAGDVAFLRSASGQTGMVKEGDSLGALKLVRIGINRVLVEDDGQQKELTVFSGYGGESLLSKEKDQSK